MKIAIVGSGISGLAAAHHLKGKAQITLYEANDYFGGHTNTVDITLPTPQGPQTWGIDTGFLVFNENTYPQLISLFKELNVEVARSDMSFSVQVPGENNKSPIEWSGNNLFTLFSQKKNLINPSFWRMLVDLVRFNQICTDIAKHNQESHLSESLETFLNKHQLGESFRNWYLLPMLGCIWSCPTHQMLQFPVATMIRFCHNHGLLQIFNRPQWFTVFGGAKHYVEKIISEIPNRRINCPVHQVERDESGIKVHTSGSVEQFDHVILATHSDQSLRILANPSQNEKEILGAIQYQPNKAVLHTDSRVLPKKRSTWAAWNYQKDASTHFNSPNVCLHYLLNRLQPIPFEQPIIETLNPTHPISEEYVLAEFEYSHPVFDQAAIQAQNKLDQIQGKHRTWFCGAWTGYGFHEDGLKSGYQAANQLLASVDPSNQGKNYDAR
jgi:uncharacterized protein